MVTRRRGLSIWLASAVTASLTLGVGGPVIAAPGGGGGHGGGGGMADTGSLYSDLVVALRAENGTPILTEYEVIGEEETSLEYCVQPVSYEAVPGVPATVNPLDGRDVWVIPLQGEWIEDPVDPLPVGEIEPCDPQPQYAMFVAETELERLNLTRTSESVLERKIADVEEKLLAADTVSLDPAGRLAVDGASLDASPEFAAIYKTLMTTGTVPGLDFADLQYDAWQLAAVAVGTAASKPVPLTVDSIEYYNRIVGFTSLDPLPSWGTLSFLTSADPDPATPMPVDVLPAGEKFVDYGDFSYNRADTFVGATTWLDVATLTWHVDRVLDVVQWTNLTPTAGLTPAEVDDRTLTGVTAFAQMADDARAVINYLHENDVILPGFYMDPVLVDTYDEQMDAITFPAVQLTAPEIVFQTLPFVATGSLFNPWGGELIDEARVRVTIDAPGALSPGDVTLASGGQEVPLTASGEDLTGWWGPDTGFAMAPGYRVSTDFDVTVAGTAPSGDYTVMLELVDVDDPATTLAADTSALSVQPAALAVLWGGELPVLGTQGTYYPVSVRVYSPTAQDGVLTFTLTGPGDDPTTDLLEELAVGDARIYASNGVDMVPMPLTLTGQDELTGTWTTPLAAGYTDVLWYLMVNEGAPVGQYGLDAGLEGGTDLAAAAYVSFAAPESHGSQPPDVGEDTTAPVVMITIDALTADSVTFSFVPNEDVTMQTRLTVDGVVGDWEDAATGTVTYTDLVPADYVFAVKATDTDGNVATYVKKFTIPEPVVVDPTPSPTPTDPTATPAPGQGRPSTTILGGPKHKAWVLDDEVTFTLGSDADDATYDVSLNGRRFRERAQDGDTVTVTGLRPGLNRIRFRARVQGEVDASPAVRQVYLPHGVAYTTRTHGWRMMQHRNAFLDTFAVTKRKGQYARLFAPKVKRVALVVTTTRTSGKVHVYLGKRRLTAKPISLRSRKVVRSRLILVKKFAKAQRGHLRVVAVGGGKVRLEGIGVAK